MFVTVSPEFGWLCNSAVQNIDTTVFRPAVTLNSPHIKPFISLSSEIFYAGITSKGVFEVGSTNNFPVIAVSYGL